VLKKKLLSSGLKQTECNSTSKPHPMADDPVAVALERRCRVKPV
jgi:hypothetical protein